jgi:hypothetical protein
MSSDTGLRTITLAPLPTAVQGPVQPQRRDGCPRQKGLQGHNEADRRHEGLACDLRSAGIEAASAKRAHMAGTDDGGAWFWGVTAHSL